MTSLRQNADPEETSQDWPVVLDEVTGALETLGDVLNREDDFRQLLHQVCVQVTRAVPGVDEASVTLLRDGGPKTTATTSQAIVDLDHDQYRTGDGPCLEAARTGGLVRVAIDDAERLWPAFARDSRAVGMGSFLSVPLVVGSRYSGAINCYSAQHHGFVQLDEQLLELYTTAVVAVLRTHDRYGKALALADQLRSALESRAVIDQAKGILMAARGLSPDQAFAILVEQSQRENLKVRELAQRLVRDIAKGW